MILLLEGQILDWIKQLKINKGKIPKDRWDKEYAFIQAAKIALYQRNKAFLELKRLGEIKTLEKLLAYEVLVMEDIKRETEH